MTDSSQKANAPIRCKLCGAVLSGSRLDGLCPACTWGALSAADQDEVDQLPVRVASHSLFQIPGHVVVEEIARGGMGIVYRARQAEPGRDVALKMLLPHQLGSAEMRERFRLEVRAIAGLEHPAILPVYQVGEHDGLPYFTMKLATGGTLSSRAERYRGNFREIAELMVTLVEAVHFAHERGVLHRDLKPGNILFDDAGRPYVSDFGLAKFTGFAGDDTPTLTRSIHLLGTPQFLPPEVAGGSVTHATTAGDIYSLGAVLYELLTGAPPFAAENLTTLLKVIVEQEPLRPSKLRAGVPRDLEVICLKCLAKEPARRYGSARELVEDLRLWLNGRPILARPVSPAERAWHWARRNPALATVSLLLLIALVSGAVLQVRTDQHLRTALGESLLAQARLQRSSGRAGQRFETLSLVSRAAEYRPSARDARSRGALAALRTEVAGALALPDLRTKARWPVHVAHFENDFNFTSNLDRYVTGTPGGGFAVFSTADHKPLWKAAGASNNPVVEVRLSPDGRWVAARFQNGHSELHPTFTNLPPRRWPGEIVLPALFAFASARERFAVAPARSGSARAVQVLDPAEAKTNATVSLRVPPTALALDPHGARLAVASDTLAVWRLADTNLLWSAPLTHNASTIAWSPDGRRLAAALDRRLGNRSETLRGDPILVFDAMTGRQESVFAEAGSRVEQLAFHPDSQSLAAATWEGELFWGGAQPDGFRLMTEGMQRALTFASDGQRLAYSPTKEELGLLDVAVPTAFSEWRAISPAQDCFTMAVSSDGGWVAAGTDSRVHLWDATSRSEVASLPLPAKPSYLVVMFGSDDEFLYYSAFSFGVRRVELVRTNLPDGRVQLQFGRERVLGEPTGFIATGYAADGRSLIVGQTRRRSVNERIPPTMWLWPDGDPTRARKLVEDFPLVGYRAVPGGPWAVTADLISPDLWIWNFETGERVRSLGIPLPVTSELAPNGRWVITRTREEFAVWEVGTWRNVSRWPARRDEQGSGSLVASPDSRLLATRTTDGRFTLRELPSGAELVVLPPPHAIQVADWRFSPDGMRLFVFLESGRMCEWNLATLRRELVKLELDWE